LLSSTDLPFAIFNWFTLWYLQLIYPLVPSTDLPFGIFNWFTLWYLQLIYPLVSSTDLPFGIFNWFILWYLQLIYLLVSSTDLPFGIFNWFTLWYLQTLLVKSIFFIQTLVQLSRPAFPQNTATLFKYNYHTITTTTAPTRSWKLYMVINVTDIGGSCYYIAKYTRQQILNLHIRNFSYKGHLLDNTNSWWSASVAVFWGKAGLDNWTSVWMKNILLTRRVWRYQRVNQLKIPKGKSVEDTTTDLPFGIFNWFILWYLQLIYPLVSSTYLSFGIFNWFTF
jgi:hypothetical protein